MQDKLKEILQKYENIEEKLASPDIINNQDTFKKLMKEHKNLTPITDKYKEYLKYEKTVAEMHEMLDDKNLDSGMREMCVLELDSSRDKLKSCEEELRILMLPRDVNDDKNVIVEIRAGTGGEEAALFANSLYRMYSMYAEARGFKCEILNVNATELGGIKEISFMIEGENTYSRLKFESGVHRVQRVPDTESSGRIHTSAVTVAVLPEAEDVEIEINPSDVQIDTFRASGAGGQHVNKTDSAIRLTYLPTGMVVECQDERSQHKNRDRAFKILRSRLYDEANRAQEAKIAQERRSQVGSGDRSERIRTYNFPQGRVSDHRINLTLYKINEIMDGSLDELIDALISADHAAKLSAEID